MNEDTNSQWRSEGCGGEDPWPEGEGHEDDVDEEALPVVVAVEGNRGGGMDEEGVCAEERDKVSWDSCQT